MPTKLRKINSGDTRESEARYQLSEQLLSGRFCHAVSHNVSTTALLRALSGRLPKMTVEVEFN